MLALLFVAAVWSHKAQFARWPVTKESRYGMRGCRIGEASNPGPPGTIRLDGVSEAAVQSLEQALTAVDTSDEEPLERAMTGRHVVRRVGDERSEFRSTKLESSDESIVRCHSGPYAEVDTPDDEGVPSMMNPVLYLRILVGATRRI